MSDSETNDVNEGSGSSACSAATVDALVDVITSPTADDLWILAGDAMRRKEELFKAMGFEVNHKISEGDVRCVLQSLRQQVEAKAREATAKP